MDLTSVVQWLFYGVVSFVAMRGVSILDNLEKSVTKLNENMALVIKESQWHERWLIRHDEELNKLKETRDV